MMKGTSDAPEHLLRRWTILSAGLAALEVLALICVHPTSPQSDATGFAGGLMSVTGLRAVQGFASVRSLDDLKNAPTDWHMSPGMIGRRAPGLVGLCLGGWCAGWLRWRLADLGSGRWCGVCLCAGWGCGQGRRCAGTRCAPLVPAFSLALLRLLA